MKLDIRKMISDPFWFAMYMLLIAYLGAPAFLKIHLGVFRKAGLVWGAVLLAIFLIAEKRRMFAMRRKTGYDKSKGEREHEKNESNLLAARRHPGGWAANSRFGRGKRAGNFH